ncbi:hypothetical protein ANO11243_029270 [Dothideomycetidae sp. 11243]|nr:hypothetical protein ANO11243_029270 [fungal sp. No.11243]
MNGVPGGDDSRDSSLSLSPVPSPQNPQYLDNIIVSRDPYPHGFPRGVGGVGGVLPALPPSAIHDAKHTVSPPTEKIKRPRKKKDPSAEDSKDEVPKEKKPRKPRVSNPDGSAASRKRQKAQESLAPTTASHAHAAGRQPTLSELMDASRQAAKPTLASLMAPAVKSETSLHVPLTAPPRPISSGQRYDPIRGLTMDGPSSGPNPSSQSSSPQTTFTKASPTLASLMNPAVTTMPLGQSGVTPQPSTPTPAQVLNPTPPRGTLSQTNSSIVSPKIEQMPPQPLAKMTASLPSKPAQADDSMEIDSVIPHPALKPPQFKALEDKPLSKQSSASATPKERRSSPRRPTGSGLLSSSDLFGGGGTSDDGKTRKGVDINITIHLDSAGGNTINIAQEIMKKYGRDAINPRAAAHRERLLQVAAAANRLEQGSGDDMSVDGSDGGEDSNMEMGGMGDDRSTAGEGPPDGDKQRKRRKRKAEDYDKEDDFIDDTELAWQESAAVAKDGFFVYSGPLIRKEDKAAPERATTSTRGRGRGRGRARGTASAGTSRASAAAKASDGSPGSATVPATRGRGGRGRGVARKPRLTQQDREMLVAKELARQEEIARLAVPL